MRGRIFWLRLTLSTLVLVTLLSVAAAAGTGDVVVGGITGVLRRARTTPSVVVRVVGGQPAVFTGDVLVINAIPQPLPNP